MELSFGGYLGSLTECQGHIWTANLHKYMQLQLACYCKMKFQLANVQEINVEFLNSHLSCKQ